MLGDAAEDENRQDVLGEADKLSFGRRRIQSSARSIIRIRPLLMRGLVPWSAS